MAQLFDLFLIAMAFLTVVVFVALHFFEAGYGYLLDARYDTAYPCARCYPWASCTPCEITP